MNIEPHAHTIDGDTARPRRIRLDRKALRRIGMLGVTVAVAVLVTGRAQATPAPRLETAPGCANSSTAQPNGLQWQGEPAMTIDTNAAYTATLESNCGDITIALDAARAPHTVNSFVFLSGQQYFDNTKCHRLTTQGIFVLQCGDPTAKGTGGPGYKFGDENLAGAAYPAGTVAMANAGPNTNGSQFFLVYKDSQLPPNYTPFGRITGGLDVLQNIAAAGVQDGSGDGTPAADVSLNMVTTSQG
ncbi:peptidylprolyl isomerase [Nocardia sp. NBC_01503]|uniref:peptidylprolyl isomerase n=1 Tax=Nocardia sp. NBC_01503 TaxID=2975997 RepID=UPI002E7AC885|nr:peptidylprolyl isomerase [Nocardia sp. NBC_01503]WTL31600.1 peptidylprolyl isomerase [Nocardia sp. NBC_01503]